MLGPRVGRVRVRQRCDDDCPAPQPCPSPWGNPAVVAVVTAAATALFNAIGEVWVESRKAQIEATRKLAEPEQPAPPPRKRGGGA